MLRGLAHLTTLAAAIGASVVSIPVAGVQLSLFRALIAVMVFIAITESLHRGKNHDRTSGNLSYPHYFMLLWLGVAVFSIIWAENLAGWAQGTFFTFIATAAILLYTLAYPKTKSLLKAMGLMSAMAILHNVIGWYESLTGNFLFFNAATEIYAAKGFAASTFANTNNFATYLVVSLAPLMVTFKNSKRHIVRAAMLVGILSSIALILSSGSRANIIALILWVATYLVISLGRDGRNVLTVVILGIGGSLALLVQRAPTGESSGDLLSFNFDGGRNSEGIRINLILNGLHFLGETFGFGVGAGNASHWMEHHAVYPTWDIINIHNWWVEILVNYGIIIFVGYIILYALLGRQLWVTATRSTDKAHRDISEASLCSLVAFAIGSTSASSIMSSEWLWVFFAVAIASTSRALTSRRDTPVGAAATA